MRLWLTAAIAAFPTISSAEFIPGSNYGYGSWQGAAYTSDANGLFSHCAISASYVSGDTLVFSVNANATVSVAVASPGLSLEVGQRVPVTIRVDNRRPFFGDAVALSNDFAGLEIQDFNSALTAFQRGRTMVIESPVGVGMYDLTGTFRALEAAKQCAMNYYRYSSAPRGRAPIAPSSDKTLLFQIATGMISDLALSDFRYLTDEEASLYFSADMQVPAVFWSSESAGLFGGVLATPAGDVKRLRETDGGDIAYLGQFCGGEIATTARDLPFPDLTAREIRALCISDNAQTEAYMTKILIGNQILYTILEFNGSSAAQAPQDRSTMSEGAAVRAASFLRE